MRSLSIAATGMLAQQLNVEVISNNMANMTTTSFKRNRAEFQDLLYQSQRRVGSTSSDAGTTVPAGVQIGLGVKTAAVYRINEQGPMQTTNNDFDIAINGQGYFQIELPSGDNAYTRAGSFQLNENGDIVTADGYPIVPRINIPAEAVDITINPYGVVSVTLDGQVNAQNQGTIQLALFPNESGLQATGDNLYMETPASGTAVTSTPGAPGYGKTIQHSLEGSNVNVVNEITSLISAQRAYEMNSKVIKTTDEMMSSMSNLR